MNRAYTVLWAHVKLNLNASQLRIWIRNIENLVFHCKFILRSRRLNYRKLLGSLRRGRKLISQAPVKVQYTYFSFWVVASQSNFLLSIKIKLLSLSLKPNLYSKGWGSHITIHSYILKLNKLVAMGLNNLSEQPFPINYKQCFAIVDFVPPDAKRI